MPFFLPGLICDARIYEAQEAAFPGSLTVDGYGMADTIQDMARIALDQADEAGLDLLDVFGHSMGGRVALEMVRLVPKRVRRLALVSTGIHPLQPGEPAKRKALQQVGYDDGFEALVDHWLPPMVAEHNRGKADIYDPMRAMCMSKGQDLFDAQVHALVNRPEVDDLLPAIDCPVLVMTGENDAWASPDQHRTIAAKLSDAELVIVPGAGHMIQMEAPDAVNEAIAAWLERPAA